MNCGVERGGGDAWFPSRKACLGEVLSALCMADCQSLIRGHEPPASLSVTVCVLSCLCLRVRVPARAGDARMGACECILRGVGETRRVEWHAPSCRRDLPVTAELRR
jgi:hypothetical protein